MAIVFDTCPLTTGATSRNGGFFLSHVPPFFKRYADVFGTKTAKQIALFCDYTLENIAELANTEGLEEETDKTDS